MELTQPPKVITIDLNKAVALVATAIITALVGGAFTGYSIAVSDHFRITALAEEVETLDNGTVKKEQYQANQEEILRRFDQHSADLKVVQSDVKTLLLKAR
jgi:hypothetical protein